MSETDPRHVPATAHEQTEASPGAEVTTSSFKHQALKEFFFPPSDLLESIGEAAKGGTHAELAESFRQNLAAVLATVSVPFRMSTASVGSRRFMQFHMAERIRARKHVKANEPLPAWAEEEAKRIARERFAETSADLPNMILDELAEALKDPEFAVAARELLRQGAVLGWAAFEVLARDLFVALLNARPDLVSQFAENEKTKRLFGIKSFQLEVLASFEFDLAHHMGDALLHYNPIDNIPAIKQIFGVLFPADEDLRQKLNSRELFVLNQRRHLIVHRRATVDLAYINLVGDGKQAGEALVIAPDELEADLKIVRDTGVALLRAARKM